jgi:hypothetical protein
VTLLDSLMTSVSHDYSEIVIFGKRQGLLDVVLGMHVDCVRYIRSDFANVSRLDIVEGRAGMVGKDWVLRRRRTLLAVIIPNIRCRFEIEPMNRRTGARASSILTSHLRKPPRLRCNMASQWAPFPQDDQRSKN